MTSDEIKGCLQKALHILLHTLSIEYWLLVLEIAKSSDIKCHQEESRDCKRRHCTFCCTV